MKSRKRRIPFIVKAILFVIAVFGIWLFVHIRAKAIGTTWGEIRGEETGKAIGSREGITKEVAKGVEDGKAEGLSAADTTADIKGFVEEVGQLEVLRAEVTLKNLHEIGDTYKVLYRATGNAIFTVDLSRVTVAQDDEKKNATIIIPRPEMELYLNQSSTQKLAEAQNFSFTVSAQEGIEAYLNSITQIEANVREKMAQYDSLMNDAEESAKLQIKTLISTVYGEEWIVRVEFKEKSRGNIELN